MDIFILCLCAFMFLLLIVTLVMDYTLARFDKSLTKLIEKYDPNNKKK